MELSKLILSALLNNIHYSKKVLPYLKKEYFDTYEEGYIFSLYKNYVVNHRSFPSEVSIKIELADSKDINEKAYNDILELLDSVIQYSDDYDIEWLIEKTEKWCKEKAIYLALCKSVEIHDKKTNLDAIPEILRKALQVSFDSSCGIEVFDEKDMVSRMKNYKKKIKKFSTGITKLDIVTDGGFESKSISVFFGGSGVGKSATLVAIGANMCKDGEDVLYVTLEMAEDKISQRFEANFLNEHINNIKNINEDSFKGNLLLLKKQQVGRLVIKEFPTATINTEHIRSLLDELEIKKNFKPTVLIVDYINLMRSSRFSGDSMYSTVKSITEELRGLAIEKELCLISATQANKEGNSSKISDLDVTNVGESKALVDTADFLVGMIYPEELREQQLQIWKVLKNRFGGTVNYKIPIKTEHSKSKVYDVDDVEYQNTLDSPVTPPPMTKKKTEVTMKFKDSQLDENLWDD